MLQLGDGHVEVRAQPVLQAAQNLPLIFQRLRVGDVNFQSEEADRHFRPATLSTDGHREKLDATADSVAAASAPSLAPRSAAASSFQRLRLLDLEAFENVAHFHVVEIRNADAAFESGAHFVHVFLEAPQRNHSCPCRSPRCRAARARPRRASGCRPAPSSRRSCPTPFTRNVSRTSARPRYVSLMTGASKPASGLLQFVEQLVDDRVQPDVHVFALRQIGGLALRPHVERRR